MSRGRKSPAVFLRGQSQEVGACKLESFWFRLSHSIFSLIKIDYANNCLCFSDLMNQPQITIPFHFVRPWLLRRPAVYRYLDSEFVELFFTKGILRLSSFEKFKLHNDQERLDSEEGNGTVRYLNKEKSNGFFGEQLAPDNAYILCGSVAYTRALTESFGTSTGFKIHDTTQFANYLSSSIPNFVGGCEGFCIYKDRRVIHREGNEHDIYKYENPETGEVNVGAMIQELEEQFPHDTLFLKSRNYSHQMEYRLIWHVHGVAGERIDIYCPEATKFCTRFQDLDSAERIGTAAVPLS